MNQTVEDIVGAQQTVVALETAPGSGIFEVQPRHRADRIELRSDARFSTAKIAVRVDNAFDWRDAIELFGPDRRIIVHTSEGERTQRWMLFEGYPLLQESSRDGGPQSPMDEYTIEAVSVYATLADDERAWMWGRRMRNAAILDGLVSDPERFVGQTAHVEALPCVFNAGGLPNRAPEPIEARDVDGNTRRICIFTYDSDPAAVRWSLLDVLRYVLWFHHLPEGPMSIREVLDLTEAAVGMVEGDDGVAGQWPVVVRRLLAAADDLDCEASNLVTAVARIAEKGGVHTTCVTDNVAGLPRSRLSIWAPDDGPSRSLHLAWGGQHADGTPRYDVGKLTPADVLHDNQLQRIRMSWDFSSIVNAPTVIGAVKRWEMTVELVPGWLPEPNLDNVPPEQREQAKQLALTADMVDFLGDDADLVDWFRWYHRWGSEFDDHRNVGRLWVLNEDGAFAPGLYNRNAPFDDYQPYDVSQVAGTGVTAPGAWTRRPRPIQPPITVRGDGRSVDVLVEVSYDAGLTWHEAYGMVSVLSDRAGIWFGINNLTSLTPPDTYPEDMNLWYAIIDQVFRVRVTGTFESDDRLTHSGASGSARTPTVRRRARLVYAPDRFRFQSRRGTANVLASVNPGGAGIEVDDSAVAAALVRRIVRAEAAGEVLAEAAIPWLDRSIGIGDRIEGLRGRDASSHGLLSVAQADGPAWCVVGKVFELSGGRLETRLDLAAVHPSGESG